MSKLVGRIIVTAGAIVAVGLVSAGPAAAAGSWVYAGSCGNGCFIYKNGSQTAYTDKWLGLTNNRSPTQQ